MHSPLRWSQRANHYKHTQRLVSVSPSSIWGILCTCNFSEDHGQLVARLALCVCLHWWSSRHKWSRRGSPQEFGCCPLTTPCCRCLSQMRQMCLHACRSSISGSFHLLSRFTPNARESQGSQKCSYSYQFVATQVFAGCIEFLQQISSQSTDHPYRSLQTAARKGPMDLG